MKGDANSYDLQCRVGSGTLVVVCYTMKSNDRVKLVMNEASSGQGVDQTQTRVEENRQARVCVRERGQTREREVERMIISGHGSNKTALF